MDPLHEISGGLWLELGLVCILCHRPRRMISFFASLFARLDDLFEGGGAAALLGLLGTLLDQRQRHFGELLLEAAILGGGRSFAHLFERNGRANVAKDERDARSNLNVGVALDDALVADRNDGMAQIAVGLGAQDEQVAGLEPFPPSGSAAACGRVRCGPGGIRASRSSSG